MIPAEYQLYRAIHRSIASLTSFLDNREEEGHGEVQ